MARTTAGHDLALRLVLHTDIEGATQEHTALTAATARLHDKKPEDRHPSANSGQTETDPAKLADTLTRGGGHGADLAAIHEKEPAIVTTPNTNKSAAAQGTTGTIGTVNATVRTTTDETNTRADRILDTVIADTGDEGHVMDLHNRTRLLLASKQIFICWLRSGCSINVTVLASDRFSWAR